MPPYGQLETTKCCSCGKHFDYERGKLINRKPLFCPDCKLEKRAAAIKQQTATRKRHATTLGMESSSLGRKIQSLTIRSHAEVAAIMCITPEASRCLERSAMAKIRKFFKLELLNKQLNNSLRNTNETF